MHLPALQTDHGMISLLELDQALEIAHLLDLDPNIQGGQEQLEIILGSLIKELAQHPSAVVADARYSFPKLAADIEQGLVLRLEQIVGTMRYESVPQLTPNWGVDEVANNYAVAKLELWYHPAEAAALDKKKLVAELHSYCQYVGIDFLLKLNVYAQPDETEEQVVFQETQLQAVQELRANCDLLALQYPGNALASATITAELDHPWIVSLSAEYETSKQQLRVALENEAVGFMTGSILWQEISQLRQKDHTPNLEEIQRFISTTARDRMIELVRITNEFGKS